MDGYAHGHHGSVVSSHAARTAADSADFLLRHLEPTMRLLDVGCGPGSITIDLAHRVGSAVGIDAASEAIGAALSAAEGTTNVEFLVADTYRLPFPDASFDVVFAHQVLQHLSRPVEALREMHRVLQPGGLVAVRDADYGTMVHDPHEPRLDQWLEMYTTVARRLGGDPDAGRKLAGWVRSAGFSDIEVTVSAWSYTTADRISAWRDLWVSRLLDARLGELAVEMRLADRAHLEHLADGWRAWADSPQPFFAFLHGEVVARRTP